MMYTSAIRYTVNHARALEQAQNLMDHQRKHNISPNWSCTRYPEILLLLIDCMWLSSGWINVHCTHKRLNLIILQLLALDD